jgi:hypothetical protein
LRKQHTDADRLTFREFSAGGSSKWRRGIFVTETKRSTAQRSKKHSRNSKKRFYKSRPSSALRKRHYLLVLESGVTKSLTQNGNNRARRWILTVIVMPAHLC